MNYILTDLATSSGWTFYFDDYRPSDEKRREAIFAQGNGVFMTRSAASDADMDEEHYPGTYWAGCYEYLHSQVEGECDRTESLANLPNWLTIKLRVNNGAWSSLDTAELLHYRHGLNLRDGTTWREWSMRDSRGRTTRFCEHRLVSMADPFLGALSLEVTPVDWSGPVEVYSAIDGAVVNANVRRYKDYEQRHIETVSSEVLSKTDMRLSTRTRRSAIAIDQAVRTQIKGVKVNQQNVLQPQSSIAQQFKFDAEQGVAFTIEKYAALCVSSMVEAPDLKECTARTLDRATSFEQVRDKHENAWRRLWKQVAINAENDSIALGLRFQAFHLLQTVSPHSAALDVGIPARGWHGEVYRGQVFWDEIFVLPFFNFRFPKLAQKMLIYRYRRLDAARRAARESGFQGAMYPWRSAYSGREVTPSHQKNLISGRWMNDPTHLQHHIGSAVVFNIWRYYLATGDYEFLSQYGAEVIFEIARFWASIAHFNDGQERFEITGVIGPDEYHNKYPDQQEPGLNNNAYTNLMAVWSLCRALELCECLRPQDLQRLTTQLNLTAEELAGWDAISRKMRLCFHDDGVISQFEGFEELRPFDREQLPEDLRHERIDWVLEAQGENADQYQVTKQADTLTLFYLLPEREIAALFERLGYSYDRSILLRTADYYLARSSHRSSLSQVVYAGALAFADPARSWRLYSKALATDLEALDGESTAEGIHLGAMGGTLDILQRCYAGIWPSSTGLRVTPAMPEALGRVEMELLYHGQQLKVETCSFGVHIFSAGANERDIPLITSDGNFSLVPGKDIFIKNQH